MYEHCRMCIIESYTKLKGVRTWEMFVIKNASVLEGRVRTN